jgi:basic membrane lipoprotein Med (substrate-binding protein (PBP1-ABC) superfamily)
MSIYGEGQRLPAPEDRPGLVLDVGGLGDDGFNDSAYAGLKRAEKDFGVKGDFLESTAPTDYADNLTQLAENGFDPVIAVGYLMTEDLTQVSKQFPDTQFAIVDGIVAGAIQVPGSGKPIVSSSSNPYNTVWELLRNPDESRQLVEVEHR